MLARMSASDSMVALRVLAGRVADLGGAAAHQRDRPVPGLLQPVQHHDLDQVADVQRAGGGVEADVAGHDLARGQRVERRHVGALVDEAALVEHAQEIRLVLSHAQGIFRVARDDARRGRQ